MAALIDLHVHSSASPCSILTPEVVAREARARGLDAVAVVDHGALPSPGYLEALRGLGLPAFGGVEVDTADGDLLVFGAPVPPAGLSGEEVVRRAWGVGGAVVAAHPFRRSRPAGGALLRLALPLETVNGRCSPEENEAAESAARLRARPATGGSDAHEPGEVGVAATRFPRLPSHAGDLARLLREGRFAPAPPGAVVHAA